GAVVPETAGVPSRYIKKSFPCRGPTNPFNSARESAKTRGPARVQWMSVDPRVILARGFLYVGVMGPRWELEASMPNTRNVKMAGDLEAMFAETRTLYLTDYRGLKVSDLATLRRQLREVGVDYRV